MKKEFKLLVNSKEHLLQKYDFLKNQSIQRIRDIDEVTLEIEALQKVFAINEKALKSCENVNNMLHNKCHELSITNELYIKEIVKLRVRIK